MKKKNIILIVVALIIIAAAGYVWWRINNRWTDLNGVTTVFQRNTVYMNSKPGEDSFAGSGQITVDKGKHIHVKYALDSGSFDLAFRAYISGRSELDFSSAVFDNLPDSGEVFGKNSVSGKGTLDFKVEAGTYEVYFKLNKTVGSATVTAEN